MSYDWNNEVILQFYATVLYEHPTYEKYEIMHFQIKGHPYYVSYARLAIFLVLILMIWTSPVCMVGMRQGSLIFLLHTLVLPQLQIFALPPTCRSITDISMNQSLGSCYSDTQD